MGELLFDYGFIFIPTKKDRSYQFDEPKSVITDIKYNFDEFKRASFLDLKINEQANLDVNYSIELKSNSSDTGGRLVVLTDKIHQVISYTKTKKLTHDITKGLIPSVGIVALDFNFDDPILKLDIISNNDVVINVYVEIK